MNRRATGWFLILSLLSPFAAVAADADPYIKGRLQGYRGLYEFHIAALSSRNMANQAGVLHGQPPIRQPENLISSFHQGLKRSTSWVSWILSAWVLV